MARVTATSVSLEFPVRSLDAAPGSDGPERDDKRLAYDAKGRLRGIRAVRDVNIDLQSGDRLAIIGANGSGKTTFLQILAGILPPDSGQVEVEGACTNLINLNLGVRREASGHRNITLRGLASGRSREEIEAKRAEIARFSELEDFLDLPVGTYSAGMRMRLSFAIATAFDTDVLILDEWISTGDKDFRRKAGERMDKFVESAGVLVLASHNAAILRDQCNKALWLDRGEQRAFGPIGDILDAYEAEVDNAG